MDSALTAVNITDLGRLSRNFGIGASQTSASGKSLTDSTRFRNAPFGSGSGAIEATKAYTQARDRLADLTHHIGSLMRQHGDALDRAAGTYEKTQAGNVGLIRTQR